MASLFFLRKYPFCVGSFLLTGSLFIFFLSKSLHQTNTSIESSLEMLLPKDEKLISIQESQGGFSNLIWQVQTGMHRYILRQKNPKTKKASFWKDLIISRNAALYDLAPKLIGFDCKKQQMLLQYVEHVPWPSYEDNQEPYKETIALLKTFHEKIPSPFPAIKHANYFPFKGIISTGRILQKELALPTLFSEAIDHVERIFQELKPWLEKHAVLCHGDFGKQNILLTRDLHPIFIDFDSASMGDPFLDIAKFTLCLSAEQKEKLLQIYLGRAPILEETRHFQLIDASLLMLVATTRLHAAKNMEFSSQEKLSLKEMEELVSSKDPHPSFLEVPFEDGSCKAKQKAALLALMAFEKKYKELFPL